MEPNELDKIFRQQIAQDASGLNAEELQAKENVWRALEMNVEKKRPDQTMGSQRWWLLAAAFLFLTFGASMVAMYNKSTIQPAKYNKVQQEYERMTNNFESVNNKLLQLDEKLENELQGARKQNIEPITALPIIETQIRPNIFNADFSNDLPSAYVSKLP